MTERIAAAAKGRRVVGAKQVLRAIASGEALEAYLASDADPFVKRPIREACERAGVPLFEAGDMEALGRACGIAVGAAAAALRRE